MRATDFTKMEGFGNDFVVIEGPVDLTAEEIILICNRRLGVGADGVLTVSRGDSPRMGYWNADGSSAEMCGNGLRCIARYVRDAGWVDGTAFTVETPAGPRRVRVDGNVVEAEIGEPRTVGRRTFEGREFHLVDVGNPHAVTLVDDLDSLDVESVGRALQPEFERGVNVEFVLAGGDEVAVRVWERGVGETRACGTGMVAAAVTTAEMDAEDRVSLDWESVVSVPGGVGRVYLRDGVAWLAGPANYVFSGTFSAH